MPTYNEVESAITKAFPGAEIIVEDLRGDNNHYAVTITSEQFNGKTRIAQHRMVQDAVKDHDIHALAIKTNPK